MGVTLQEQGKPEEAIEAYNKALAIKPDNAEAYNNMGITLADEGKLEEALEVYHKSLTIKPDYAEATENFINPLPSNLLPIIANLWATTLTIVKRNLNSEVMLRPKYQVKQLIKTFLWSKFHQSSFAQQEFQCFVIEKLVSRLKPKDRVFLQCIQQLYWELVRRYLGWEACLWK